MTTDSSTFKTQNSKLSVCYLGAFDQDYARNRVLRAGLEARGWQVSLAPLPRGLDVRRSLPLLWRSMRHEARHCDALIVAEHNQLLAPLAIALGRLLGKPVLVDYTVGLYESRVLDNNDAKARPWRHQGWRAMDAWNVATAAGVFTDTDTHRAAFRGQIGGAARRMAVVPVGVDPTWFEAADTAREKGPDEPLLVQFYGNFNPFHGTEVILRALSWLNTDPRFRFEMIGRGPMHQAAVKRANLLGIEHLDFIDPPDTPDLIAHVQEADICLGVFARRDKTEVVVPHRILECLALGKPVVTADSTAISEFFAAGRDLITVPPSNPGELARTLRALADDPALRLRVAAAGQHAAQAFTPEQAVAPLVALLERVI